MPKNWNEIETDDILNFHGAQTADIARYQRIMEFKNIQALSELRAGLFELQKTIHIVGDKAEERLKSVEQSQKSASEAQGKMNAITIALTVVIALSTAVYTWITWESLKVQKDSNRIALEQSK
ncbi:hypothetical protein [Reinekea sp. G2M2-21]|uniref:hypothetical protein n=1 Tax=Reinekea sp. G2M2-21 TaxID=2788942 RepID=UPI0018AB5F2E|nr:hypothetical protein [Reinekea sp. G2M2-21]